MIFIPNNCCETKYALFTAKKKQEEAKQRVQTMCAFHLLIEDPVQTLTYHNHMHPPAGI